MLRSSLAAAKGLSLSLLERLTASGPHAQQPATPPSGPIRGGQPGGGRTARPVALGSPSAPEPPGTPETGRRRLPMPVPLRPAGADPGAGAAEFDLYGLQQRGEWEVVDGDGLNGFHPAYVTMLTHNYRSHPALLAVPNALFYGGALLPSADPARTGVMAAWGGLTPAARAVAGGFPLLFHGVEGEDARQGTSPSWFNRIEVRAIPRIKFCFGHSHLMSV